MISIVVYHISLISLTIGLPRDDEVLALVLREQVDDAPIEGDEVRGGIHRGVHPLGLCVSTAVSDEARLVHVDDVRVGVPGVLVRAELVRVVTLFFFVTAALLDVEQT